MYYCSGLILLKPQESLLIAELSDTFIQTFWWEQFRVKLKNEVDQTGAFTLLHSKQGRLLVSDLDNGYMTRNSVGVLVSTGG